MEMDFNKDYIKLENLRPYLNLFRGDSIKKHLGIS